MEITQTSESDVLSLLLNLPLEKRRDIFEKMDKIQNLMESLETHIIQAKPGVLNLKDNWNGENAIGYTQNTWDQAINFLRRFLKQLWTHFIFIPFPNILPGPDGSIDLNWDSENTNLLINFPRDLNEPVSFYGEHLHLKEIEGSIEIDLVDSVLVPWMMSRQ